MQNYNYFLKIKFKIYLRMPKKYNFFKFLHKNLNITNAQAAILNLLKLLRFKKILILSIAHAYITI